jgi:hypothetical protein
VQDALVPSTECFAPKALFWAANLTVHLVSDWAPNSDILLTQNLYLWLLIFANCIKVNNRHFILQKCPFKGMIDGMRFALAAKLAFDA